MSLRITNLNLPVEEAETALPAVIAQRLRIGPQEITGWRILRKSLDARSRTHLKFTYTVLVDLPAEREAALAAEHLPGVERFAPKPFAEAEPGTVPLEHRPVIVGSGPAGLLAGYYLAQKGYRPLILERGQPVKDRVRAVRSFDKGGPHHPENNYLFGEGGAGCFSDGKLTCRISGPDVEWVLRRFVECGGRPSLVYEHRPHLGSNVLPLICRNFRRKIEQMGGEYRFGCRLEQLDVRDGRIRGVMTSGGYIPAEVVLLGIGHSARDTYHMLHQLGVPMVPKAFQLGLRIEQPQENINRHCYGEGRYLRLLGAADYTLSARGERDVYTFCMCAGGYIIPSISEPEMFCTNGMSHSRHDSPFANSGLVVTLQPDEFGGEHPLAGVQLQRRYEAVAFELGQRNYLCPLQPVDDFLQQRSTPADISRPCSYRRGIRGANLAEVLPPVVVRALRSGLPILDRKWRGDFLKDAVLVGPEMRGSSPVRMMRDRQSRQSPGFAGLYPMGEGAGYAGGIVTAAVDGLRSAQAVVRHFAPLEPAATLG